MIQTRRPRWHAGMLLGALALSCGRPSLGETPQLWNPLATRDERAEALGWQPVVVALRDEAGDSLSIPHPIPGPRQERSSLASRKEFQWFLLGAIALTATDSTTVHWLDADLSSSGPSGDESGRKVSTLGTHLPILFATVLPAALDGRYGRRTSTLAAVALVNTGLATQAIKFLAGKERPWQSAGDLRFHGPGTSFESFPSGHTAAAFTVATVLGHRYRKYRLPLYLLAGAVGWARVNAARHFPSDVFVGAGIGIYSGRYVLRHGARLWSLRF